MVKCKICNRNGELLCHVQGLPGMCKTCYRFFMLYSKKDVFGLERMSSHYPITVCQIKKAVEKTKEPFIADSKAADRAAKTAFFNAFIGTLDAISDGLSEDGANDCGIANALPQRAQGSRKWNTETVKMPRKKKGRFRWYQWVLIGLLLYIIINFVFPLAAAFIWYYLSQGK